MSVEDITTACRLELAECPDFVINAEIPRVARTICEETGIWRVNLDEISLEEGVVDYALSLPDGAGLVRMAALLDADTAFDVSGRFVWAVNEVIDGLYIPVPESACVTSVIPRAALYPLSFSDIPACVHTECRAALEYGVLARLFTRPGKPWSDAARGQYYAGMYAREIGKKKIKLYKGSRDVSLSVRPRPFV